MITASNLSVIDSLVCGGYCNVYQMRLKDAIPTHVHTIKTNTCEQATIHTYMHTYIHTYMNTGTMVTIKLISCCPYIRPHRDVNHSLTCICPASLIGLLQGTGKP